MQKFVKIFLFCLIAGMMVGPLSGQVVINSTTTTPTADGSALLELQSPDMGFLIPKITLTADLTDPSPVAAPATGLLIYNLIGGSQAEGFYFWDGSKWTEVINEKRVFANEQFGELYEIISGGTPTTVALTTSGTWYGWNSAWKGTLSTGMTADTTLAFASKMYISRYGLYNIQLAMSVGGSQNQTITTSVFIVNGATETETRIKVFSKMGSQGALISGSSMGVLELVSGDELDIRFSSNSNGETLDIYSINFIVTKVGE